MTSRHGRIKSVDSDSLAPPAQRTRDGRSYSNTEGSRPPGSFAASAASHGPPGSFSSDLRSVTTIRSDLSRPDYFGTLGKDRVDKQEEEFQQQQRESEQRQAGFKDQLERELKIKIGSENLLEALHFKKNAKERRMKVESQLDQTNRNIAVLKHNIAAEVERSRASSPTKGRPGSLSQLFKHGRSSSQQTFATTEEEEEDDNESPTYVLVETLQALEEHGQPADHYVNLANNLIELFKRHNTLKYDLVWTIFGVRIQGMLLSDNREVAAAGFRMLRYAITDRKSLSTMRSFSTDIFVLLALVKEGRDSVDREQALKFVRAFLDVKDGLEEVAQPIMRALVAIAEQHDDRLRHISIMTLCEMLIRKPALVASASGVGALSDALAEGLYLPAESLSHAFLYLLDFPNGRKYFRSGHELQGPFAVFSDESMHMNEERLKTNAKVIAGMLKTWPGLTALSSHGFLAIKSLTTSLFQDSSRIKDIVLEIILDLMRIKSPSWSTSYLAGRRLTTYGRVGVSRTHSFGLNSQNNDSADGELVKHFTALLVAVFIRAGLLDALAFTLQNEKTLHIQRKAILLMGEALELTSTALPTSWTERLQVLPTIFSAASVLSSDDRFDATSLIYQIDSVNRTLYRTEHNNKLQALTPNPNEGSATSLRRTSDLQRDTLTQQIEDPVFRQALLDSQVPITPKYQKWNWELIQKIIDGPLQNLSRLEFAMKQGKFMKRLIGFFRPFKYRFSDIRNTRQTQQRYVPLGCSLVRALLQSTEGSKFLAENKLMRQIAECLAQVDRLSGLTSAAPLFSADRLEDTLSGGYFALLGAISSSIRGLAIIERWKIANMFYHIVELQDRNDLIKMLLSSMDYTIPSHLRVILSKALTACGIDIRVFATRILRRYAVVGHNKGAQQSATESDARSLSTPQFGQIQTWAIDLLVTQLYDPQVEVCEVAVKILEEACNNLHALEYVVYCRPALDHLGEIGAPLLLRFLSTSLGYHYLDDLDYISQEMDDWFLGRNETYVRLVEASVGKALSRPQNQHAQRQSRNLSEEFVEDQHQGSAPPHFYRELTRTAEGCRLLERKGHFEEFVSVIRGWGMEYSDAEAIMRVKGCMWAVGNIGSMKLGAPFLETSDVVELIVNIAMRSQVMSMRGTAFFVLGLISKSIYGQELLAERGWDVALDDCGQSTGICLPRDIAELFQMPAWGSQRGLVQIPDIQIPKITDDDPTNARILSLITDLGNTVLAKTRAAELHSLKNKKVAAFESPQFFQKVLGLVDRYHFRLQALRFIMELFDKSVVRQVVLDEEDADDEGDTTLRSFEPSSPIRGIAI
ncbi:MAG: hypothetical protein Q9159_006677 [Coniocarpon cinnabarinum]